VGCELWVVGCGLWGLWVMWVVGCGLWVVGCVCTYSNLDLNFLLEKLPFNQ